MLSTTVVLIYGMFNVVGGLIGYLKAKSTASLMAGSIAGLVLLGCAYALSHGSQAAAIASLIVALALGTRFAMTWRRTHRVMPDLIMVALSLVTLLAVGWTLLAG